MATQQRLSRWKKRALSSDSPVMALESGLSYIAVKSDDYEVLLAVSRLLHKQKKHQEAVIYYSKAELSSSPNEMDCLLFAESLLHCGNYKKARKILALHNSYPTGLLVKLANIYNLMDDHENALKTYNSMTGEQIPTQFKLEGISYSLRNIGDINTAKVNLKKSIAIKPTNNAIYTLSRLNKVDTKSNNLSLIDAEISKHSKDSPNAIALYFAKAKELEDLKNYDKAFAYYQKGASLQKSIQPYTSDKESFELLKNLENNPSQAVSTPHKNGIFVLGMHRSGSTLVERVLSSHSQTETYGEAKVLWPAISSVLKLEKANRLTEIATNNCELDYQKIQNQYYEHIVERNGKKTFIDKHPHNFMAMGIILKSFPNAKIIYTQKKPMDACFSNYKYLFASGLCSYSYDFDSLAEVYLNSIAFAQYWRDLYPNQVFISKHEDLCANPKDQISKLLDFCNLPHEARCLTPEKNKLASSTASSSQVREAINNKYINQWKPFEKHLQPLIDIFLSKGFSYEGL